MGDAESLSESDKCSLYRTLKFSTIPSRKATFHRAILEKKFCSHIRDSREGKIRCFKPQNDVEGAVKRVFRKCSGEGSEQWWSDECVRVGALMEAERNIAQKRLEDGRKFVQLLRSKLTAENRGSPSSMADLENSNVSVESRDEENETTALNEQQSAELVELQRYVEMVEILSKTSGVLAESAVDEAPKLRKTRVVSISSGNAADSDVNGQLMTTRANNLVRVWYPLLLEIHSKQTQLLDLYADVEKAAVALEFVWLSNFAANNAMEDEKVDFLEMWNQQALHYEKKREQEFGQLETVLLLAQPDSGQLAFAADTELCFATDSRETYLFSDEVVTRSFAFSTCFRRRQARIIVNYEVGQLTVESMPQLAGLSDEVHQAAKGRRSLDVLIRDSIWSLISEQIDGFM